MFNNRPAGAINSDASRLSNGNGKPYLQHQNRGNVLQVELTPGNVIKIPSTGNGREYWLATEGNESIDLSPGKIDSDNRKATDQEIDSKLDKWAVNTNVYHQASYRPGTKTGNKGKEFLDTTNAKGADKNQYPSGIYVNVNGIKGHYITKEVEIHQGHSNTRQYGNRNGIDTSGRPNNGPMAPIPTKKPTVQGIPALIADHFVDIDRYDTPTSTDHGPKDYTTDSDTPIDYDENNDKHETNNGKEVESTILPGSLIDGGEYHHRNDRKPKFISENKTADNPPKESAIMKINEEKIDLDIFGVELIRDQGK